MNSLKSLYCFLTDEKQTSSDLKNGCGVDLEGGGGGQRGPIFGTSKTSASLTKRTIKVCVSFLDVVLGPRLARHTILVLDSP